MSPFRDLRFAMRTWRKNPIPPLTAVLTLALGAGAHTAIFSVIHAVMLKPLPYRAPHQLAQIWSVDLDPHSNLGAMAHRDKQLVKIDQLDRLLALSLSFADIGYYRPWMTNVSGAGEAERVYTAEVSSGFLTTLAVSPVLGRAFRAEDMTPGKDRVVILSDAFWRRHFHGDPAALGRTVTVDGFPCAVVGVLAPGTRLIVPSLDVEPDLLQPITAIMDWQFKQESAFAFGRLRSGVTVPAARAEVDGLARRLSPDAMRGINLVPLGEEVSSGIRPALLILFGAAGCVLLIACGNIASLLLASVASREGELALRTALGARRRRLVGQLLTESAALSAAGTALGFVLSLWMVRAIVQLYPDRIPRLESFGPEPAVFAFTALVAIAAALLFGGLPAWRYSRAHVQQVQQVLQGATAAGGHTRGYFREVLMTAQVAAVLVLLIGAGLLLRSFLLMRAINPGFERHNLLLAHLMLDDKTYPGPAQQAAFVDRLIERLYTLPGVEAAGATNSLPLEFNFLMSVTARIEGRPDLGDHAEIDCRSVTPGFLQTMGIGLVAGRYLLPSDSAVGGGVMVNQAFAREYFGGRNPVGRHLYFGKEARAIAGVIPDIRDLHLDRKTIPAIYIPISRQPTAFVDLAIRTAADPAFLVNAVRAELRAIDPNQPLGKVTTMEAVIHKAVAKPRWYAVLVGSFAGLALLLAAMGIYGVAAHAVSRRTREIGIRMAMGAAPEDVMRMVLLRAMVPAAAGVLLGLPLAFAVCRVLAGVLYGVKPLDPVTSITVSLMVPIVALAAAYLPARRATRIDPIAALRCT